MVHWIQLADWSPAVSGGGNHQLPIFKPFTKKLIAWVQRTSVPLDVATDVIRVALRVLALGCISSDSTIADRTDRVL